ncbi:MAG: hypothetical protein EU530_10030 [Promethearchaeota archaeon]|nr:MAG: hypothetical protein EU530_10030 [Candidatus Lokiarchaeota archaeon]
MTLEVSGKIIRELDGTGLANFRMEIFAIDQLLFEKMIGETNSNESGEFRVYFDDKDFLEKFGDGYGIYLVIYNPKNVLISHGRYDQLGKIQWSAKNLVEFDLRVSIELENKDPIKWDSLFKRD